MKKILFTLLSMLVLASFVLAGCAAPATAVPPTQAPARCHPGSSGRLQHRLPSPLKIAFFVSDLSNVFHQAQATEAKKYAKEKYGADVLRLRRQVRFRSHDPERRPDHGAGHGRSHPAALGSRCGKPGVLAALQKGIIMTSFFSPLGDTGIPTARNDEKGISFAMGAEMATQWKAANPD